MGLSLFWNFKDRLFQIDANFGLTAAVLEMLVYSNRTVIGILPALPDKWRAGSIAGVLTRPGAEVSVRWDLAERRVEVGLSAKRSRTFTLRLPGEIGEAACATADVAVGGDAGANGCRVELKQGESATVSIVLK